VTHTDLAHDNSGGSVGVPAIPLSVPLRRCAVAGGTQFPGETFPPLGKSPRSRSRTADLETFRMVAWSRPPTIGAKIAPSTSATALWKRKKGRLA
jgi:hypothetical protein